jgi:antibiotic biosynthesis monooxygenase (ABM) superfamily enzyme
MKLMEMIKEHDDKFEELLASHENLLCAFGRLVDDIIDKELGLCVDYKLVENATELLDKEKWMDSTRSHVWAQVVQGLCDTSVKKMTMMKLVEQEEEKLEEDYRVAQLKGEV